MTDRQQDSEHSPPAGSPGSSMFDRDRLLLTLIGLTGALFIIALNIGK